MNLFIACPYAPHLPHHAASYARLVQALRPLTIDYVPTEFRTSQEYCEATWLRGLQSGADHCLFLTDDAVPCDDFPAVLEKVIAARPRDVLGLYPVHPNLADYKDHRWVSTDDGLIGVGYVLPRDVLGDFLHWRESALLKDTRRIMPDDTQASLWCLWQKRKIWHPIPALIDHDDSPSTLGNSEGRRATVPSIPGMAELDWSPQPTDPHLGRLSQAKTGIHKNLHWELTQALTAAYRQPLRAYALAQQQGENP